MRSLKNNRMRNAFAIAAIALTCMLFTTLAAMGTGISDAMQESTMREVGGRFHAGLKAATGGADGKNSIRQSGKRLYMEYFY